jgi:NAD(P)-dependent dehydrogenase (short-subunit alcohol dehydrogenase family)
MQTSNKVIVVTGAGSGIGRELTLQLLKKNANVAGVDIHENALVETQTLAGVGDDRFKGFVLDISDKTKADALPNEVITHFGSVDGIINNAGIIQKFIHVNDLVIEDIHRVMNVNFFGTLYLTKAFLPHFFASLRSPHCQYFEHGWLYSFPWTNDLWSSQSGGKTPHRRSLC